MPREPNDVDERHAGRCKELAAILLIEACGGDFALASRTLESASDDWRWRRAVTRGAA
jgi:hypothetical protein